MSDWMLIVGAIVVGAIVVGVLWMEIKHYFKN